MQHDRRLIKLAVLGSADEPAHPETADKARRIGRAAASRGCVLLTGGCPGFPHAAVQGALESGGTCIAVSPAVSLVEHTDRYRYPSDSSVIMYTGMGARGRNVILIRSADACIFISGGMGTLNEFTIAFDDLGPDCAVGILSGSGGVADELGRLMDVIGRRPRPKLFSLPEPEMVVQRLIEHVETSASTPP